MSAPTRPHARSRVHVAHGRTHTCPPTHAPRAHSHVHASQRHTHPHTCTRDGRPGQSQSTWVGTPTHRVSEKPLPQQSSLCSSGRWALGRWPWGWPWAAAAHFFLSPFHVVQRNWGSAGEERGEDLLSRVSPALSQRPSPCFWEGASRRCLSPLKASTPPRPWQHGPGHLPSSGGGRPFPRGRHRLGGHPCSTPTA